MDTNFSTCRLTEASGYMLFIEVYGERRGRRDLQSHILLKALASVKSHASASYTAQYCFIMSSMRVCYRKKR